MADSGHAQLLRERAALRQQRLLQRQRERMQVVGLSAEEADRLTRESGEAGLVLDKSEGAATSLEGSGFGEKCDGGDRDGASKEPFRFVYLGGFLDFLAIVLAAWAAVEEAVRVEAFLPRSWGEEDWSYSRYINSTFLLAPILGIFRVVASNPLGVLLFLSSIEALLLFAKKFSWSDLCSLPILPRQPQLAVLCLFAFIAKRLADVEQVVKPTIVRLAIYICCSCSFFALLYAAALASGCGVRVP